MSVNGTDSLKSLIKLVLIFVVIGILIFALPKLISCLIPFFLAWVVSIILKPLIKLLEKVKINRRIAVAFSILIAVGALGGIVYAVYCVALSEIKDIIALFDDTKDGLPVFLWNIIDELPQKIGNMAERFFVSFASKGEGFAVTTIQSVLPKIGGFAGKLPGAFVFIIVFFIATYFMSYDPKGFKEELKSIIPREKYRYLQVFKHSFTDACGGYIKAQLILMSIVFCVLFIGFLVLDIRFAFLLALTISFLDAIPVLGTGMILNPWAIICVFQGNYSTAIGLVCLYLIVLLTRQFLEPRILSVQLGIHPLITLICMYTGLKLAGIAGMIIGPLVGLVVIEYLRKKDDILRQIDEKEAKENAHK